MSIRPRTSPTQDCPHELILASTSPYRRQLLERLGLPFRCVAPACDEEALKVGIDDPRELVTRLAHAKAESVSPRSDGATVLGSDQIAHVEGEILGKPGTAERAADQLERLAGRQHELLTCVVLDGPGGPRTFTDHTMLHMRSLTRGQIEAYVAADAPLDCAGAYKIEARGIALFDRIDTADFTAIIGLPLMQTTTLLIEAGYSLPSS